MALPTSVPDNSSIFPASEDLQNDTCNYRDIYVGWVFTVIPVYIYIITALGILFNLLVLTVFLFHKKACTVAEIYLSNMAAADFLLVLFLPFWAYYISTEYRWPFGDPMCRIVPLFIVMNSSCSIFFLVLVCFDRFLALVHPLSQSKMRRRKYAKLSCLLVWCFGLLLGIPTLMCRQVRQHNTTIQHNETFSYNKVEYTCIINCSRDVYLTNDVIQTIISFIIPILIIFFCTVKIIQALRERPTEGASTQKTERKATILVLVVLLVFLICWVPFHVQRMIEAAIRWEIIDAHCTLARNLYIIKNIFIYFAFFNSDLNPILYVIVGKNFRNKMWDVFTGRGSERKSSTQLTMTTSSSISSSKKISVKANEVL